MVHPTDECPQIAEHSLDLRGQFELPFFMDILPVRHRPPGVDAPVDTSSIGLQSAARFHELIEELAGIGFADGLSGKDAEGDLRGSDLLGHHE